MSFWLLSKQDVLVIHKKLIQRFGGTFGLRDEGALESALSAVENRLYYENADLITCAATYAYHLSQAHAFIDGNKRIAAAGTEIFLELNNAQLNMSNEEIVHLFLNIAAGQVTRSKIEQVFKENITTTQNN